MPAEAREETEIDELTLEASDSAEISEESGDNLPPASKPAKKGGASQKPRTKVRSLEREVLGVILCVAGLFILLALMTYDPSDPSWNSVQSTTAIKAMAPQNAAGLVGSYLADFMLQVFGLSAFVFPTGLTILGILLFSKNPPALHWQRASGLLLLTVLGAALLSLHGPLVHLFKHEFASGGIMGEFASQIILRFFNRPGSYLILLGAFLATLIAVTQLSLPKAARLTWKTLRQARAFLATYFPLLMKHVVEPIQAKLSSTQNNSPEVLETVEVVDPFIGLEPGMSLPLKPLPESTLTAAAETPSEVGGPKIITLLPHEPAAKLPKHQETLTFNKVEQDYKLPPTDLLHMEIEKPKPVDEWSLRMNSKILEKKLLDYGVSGRVVEIHPGPVITMYEFEPAPGVKVKNIVNLADDLSLTMGGRTVRILAPIPNKAVVGIEIPNLQREIVTLFEIIGQSEFLNEKGLTLALGKDIEGRPKLTNMTKMPHLLIAGATGTGKSVALNSMICSFLMKSTPDEVRFLMIDPKMVELAIYEGIPHLLLPVITDPKKSSVALKWAVMEMEARLKLLSKAGTRNIENFNKKALATGKPPIEAEPPAEESDSFAQTTEKHDSAKAILNRHGQLPYIVIIIDELADLMIVAGREIEESITRLAQMARAVGIHLIIATQRPSVDVITGLIKANLPTRISFKVSSRIDSRTILDSMGAESLLGDGDMLFMPPGSSQLQRIHGAYITEREVHKVVEYLKKQGNPDYQEQILDMVPESSAAAEADEEDELFDQAIDIVKTSGQASVSYVQRRLQIGYNRAARIVEMMEKRGIVGPANGSKPREIYISQI